MIFSTPIFIFGFLPIFIAVYYAVPFKHRSIVILVFSYLFYGWWKASFLALIFGMSLVSYAAAHFALHGKTRKTRKAAVIGGVSADLLILGYYKYFNFFRDNANAALETFGAAPFEISDIILPIGISFHTFQSISYIVDIFRKDAPPARNLIDFLAFGSLFPQLIAGPVLRYKDISDQFANREQSFSLFAQGLKRFFQGLAMKVLLADTLATIADPVFASQAPSMADAWLGGLAYTFQLFFDFAGYSAMAIGLGLMIGFRFIENFNHPYLARSITEFWKRWHISLSTWLRDYLYVPLGGNRKGKRRTYVNLVLTMVLGGFWHGANWTFLIWGMWHGGIMAAERALGAKNGRSVYPQSLALGLTFLFVLLGWVMFRAPNVGQAINIYEGMIGLNGLGFSQVLLWQIDLIAVVALILAMSLCAAPALLAQRYATIAATSSTYLFLPIAFLTLTKLIGQSNSPFLYFQF